MCAGAERDADVAREGADVGSFAAGDCDCDFGYFRIEIQEPYAVDDECLRLELYLLSFARHIVGALAVDFAGGESGWNLLDGSCELREGLLNESAGDMGGGVGGVDFSFEVERGGCGAEAYCGGVFLHSGLEGVDEFGRTSGHDYHHA